MQRNPRTLATIGALAGACALAGFAIARGQGEKRPESSAHAAPAEARAANAETPQAFLAHRAGEYTRTIRFVGGQGGQGPPSTGTSKISVILNGGFIQEQNEDVVFGKPVSGMRVYGYNDATKQYEAAWMYTMSPAILTLTGTSTDGGKVVDYAGVTYTANGGSLALHARVRQVDDDQFVVTLYSAGPDGKQSAFQETTYQRKK